VTKSESRNKSEASKSECAKHMPVAFGLRISGLFRLSAFGFRIWTLLCVASGLFAAPANSPAPAGPDSQALALVRDLLEQRPVKELSLNGVFRIRHSNGKKSDVPVHYSIRLAQDHWESVYLTDRTQTQGPEHLVIVHQGTQPNRYLFDQISLDGQRTNSMTLIGSDAAVSFAGSDFWLTDVGMEFLHWPAQRLVREAKITMRLGRPCKVLESTNPTPSEGAYLRVLSWIDSEMGTLIYAEAYDLNNRRFKVFSLKHFTKVNGRWQVRDMELRNDKADSRTNLEFSFDSE
jgi:hypothetical protein